MNKLPLGIAGLVFLTSGLLALSSTASAPLPPPPPVVYGATITFSDGTTMSLRADDRFQPIALRAGETVTIAAQLPPVLANATVIAQALDGGQISVDELVVAADGTASLAFQAGSPPGRYRLLLSSLGQSVTLQFQVAQP